MNTQYHSGILRSTQDHLWTLQRTPELWWVWCQGVMSANGAMTPCSLMLFSTHELSWRHGAKLMIAHGCLWMLTGFLWVLERAYKCSWVLMRAHGTTLIRAHGCSWAFVTTHEVTHQKELYYRLGIWQLHITHKTNNRWQLPRMVTYHPYYAWPPTQGWSPNNPGMVTHQKEVYYTDL